VLCLHTAFAQQCFVLCTRVRTRNSIIDLDNQCTLLHFNSGQSRMWINIGQIFCSFACPLVINIYSVCMHNKNPMTLVPRSESCHPASNVSMKPKTGISRPAVLAGECNGSADTLIATEMLANSKNFTCTEFLCRPAKSCLFGMCL